MGSLANSNPEVICDLQLRPTGLERQRPLRADLGSLGVSARSGAPWRGGALT
jgi:hypothetical protein